MSDEVPTPSPAPTHHDETSTQAKTRRGVSIHAKNPFMEGADGALIVGKNRKVINGNGSMVLVNKEDGDIVSPVCGFWHTEVVDSAQFVKLFINGVKAFRDLTNAGTRVFEVLYVVMQQNIGKDRIYICFGSLDQQQHPISRATFQRGLQELVNKKFIAATPTQGWFWINPDFVWNGDRLSFVKQYRRRADNELPGQQAITFGQ